MAVVMNGLMYLTSMGEVLRKKKEKKMNFSLPPYIHGFFGFKILASSNLGISHIFVIEGEGALTESPKQNTTLSQLNLQYVGTALLVAVRRDIAYNPCVYLYLGIISVPP